MCLFFHDYSLINESSQTHYWLTTKTRKVYIYSVGDSVCVNCGKIKREYQATLNYCPWESLYKESKHVYINKRD